MAEALNLPPLHVQAIRVPFRKTATSIGDPDELFLQQGENGGVQVDAFWRDAMGNEIHDSKELNEDEYEAIRAYYLKSEQATLPPFSSFKSGNTVGRVVGETTPATVPATQANPPIEAETEEEGITGEQVLDGIQLGLDVVGLIPVVGEAADIISAGISLARGDYVGAGLSLLSAIPFVGYLGTAGKGARYGAKMAEASGKAGKEVAETTAKKATNKATKEAAEKKANDQAAKQTPPKAEDGAKIRPKKPTTFTKNGYTYHLDDKGRVIKVEGNLKLNKSQTRNQNAQRNAGGKDRLPDDQGGHFVGRRFDGSTDEINHFAQNGKFNNSSYRKLENSWERMLKDKKDVRIEISPKYTSDSLRPDKVTIKQWIDGVPQRPITYGNNLGGKL